MASSSASDSSVSQSSACSTGGASFAAASFFAFRIRACSKSETTSGTQPQSQVGACFAVSAASDLFAAAHPTV